MEPEASTRRCLRLGTSTTNAVKCWHIRDIIVSRHTISHLSGFDGKVWPISWPRDWSNPDEKIKLVMILATKVPNESIIQPIIKQPKLINAAALFRLTQLTHPPKFVSPKIWVHENSSPRKFERWVSPNYYIDCRKVIILCRAWYLSLRINVSTFEWHRSNIFRHS